MPRSRRNRHVERSREGEAGLPRGAGGVRREGGVGLRATDYGIRRMRGIFKAEGGCNINYVLVMFYNLCYGLA